MTGYLNQYNKDTYSQLANKHWDFATVGITYDEKDPYFISTSEQYRYKVFSFIINDTTIYMGKTDMYEITQPIQITNITFPEGVPDSIQINLCSYSEEGN